MSFLKEIIFVVYIAYPVLFLLRFVVSKIFALKQVVIVALELKRDITLLWNCSL